MNAERIDQFTMHGRAGRRLSVRIWFSTDRGRYVARVSDETGGLLAGDYEFMGDTPEDARDFAERFGRCVLRK